jgi:c-di-GMP-binding flagellar brake protein YcgR
MAPQTTGAQRRKNKRFKQWNKTTITALRGGQSLHGVVETNAFTYDLSLCGAQIHAAEAFAVGTTLRLRIVLARTMDSVTLTGEVKWLKRHPSENVYQMGLEFYHETTQGFMTLMKCLFSESSTPGIAKPAPAFFR